MRIQGCIWIVSLLCLEAWTAMPLASSQSGSKPPAESHPDNAVVRLLTAPAGASIHAKIKLDTSEVLGGNRQSPSRVILA